MTGLKVGVNPSLYWVLLCKLLIFCLMSESTQQQEDCNVFRPNRYIYLPSDLQNPDSSDSDNCQQQAAPIGYQECTADARIIDEDFGPQTFSAQDRRPYYLWNKSGGSMLFEFSSPVTITSFKLYFYLDIPNSIARPKLKLQKVGDLYQINDQLPTDVIPTAVDRLHNMELRSGLHNETVQVSNFGAPSQRVVLFVFSSKLFSLAITEITFCTAETISTTAAVESPPTPTTVNKATTVVMETAPTEPDNQVSNESQVSQKKTSGQTKNNLSLFTVIFVMSLILLLR